MLNLLVIAIFALIWFAVGVMSATVIDRVIAVATTYVKSAVAVAVATIRAGAAELVAVFNWYVAIGKTVAAVATSIIDGLVIAMTEDLPDTSTYSLNVAAGSGEYVAGEYLVRDNGAWRNVYLTVHARALMGESADVIALQPATVHDASGTSSTRHVSVPVFGLVPFAPSVA